MGDIFSLKQVQNRITVLAGESVMLAKRHGVDLSSFFDGVRNSAGNSYVFETEVPLIYNGTYDPGFTIDLHCKVTDDPETEKWIKIGCVI